MLGFVDVTRIVVKKLTHLFLTVRKNVILPVNTSVSLAGL